MRYRLIFLSVVALPAALALTACGGGSDAATEEPATTAEQAEPAPAPATEPAPPAATTDTSGGNVIDALAAGKEVFIANCGGCHVLSDAGTSGGIGPDLDQLKPSLVQVTEQVINGGGPMPAFGNDGILTDQQIANVAAYVVSVAGL